MMGSSNSPSAATGGHFATEAGIDTWSPSWYVDPHSDRFHAFVERCPVPAARGARMMTEAVAGYRVGAFPSGLVFAEGHPAGPGSLCPVQLLPVRGLELQEQLLAVGAPVETRELGFGRISSESEGFAGLRRVDATANIDMGSRGALNAALVSVAAVVRDLPGQVRVQWNGREVGTVWLLGYAGARVLGRAYDKTAEMLARGQRPSVEAMLRLEDQRRWPKTARPDLDDLTPEAVGHRFKRRFQPLYRATEGVKVTGLLGAGERLADAVASGELTREQARVYAGDLLFQACGRSIGVPARTQRRSRSALRELGLVLSTGDLQEVEFDLSDVLEACMDGPVWGEG